MSKGRLLLHVELMFHVSAFLSELQGSLASHVVPQGPLPPMWDFEFHIGTTSDCKRGKRYSIMVYSVNGSYTDSGNGPDIARQYEVMII